MPRKERIALIVMMLVITAPPVHWALSFFCGVFFAVCAAVVLSGADDCSGDREKFEQRAQREMPPLTHEIVGGAWWLLMGGEPVRPLDADEVASMPERQEESQE